MCKLTVAALISLTLLTCSGSGGGNEGQQNIPEQGCTGRSPAGCCGHCGTMMSEVLPPGEAPCCCNRGPGISSSQVRKSGDRAECGDRECRGGTCKGDKRTCGDPGSCKPKTCVSGAATTLPRRSE
jgi:hypothetical protein